MGAGDELGRLWTRLVEAVGQASPFVRSYFIEAHPVSLSKTLLTIGFDPEFAEHLALVDNSRNHTLLQTKLSELGHPNMQVKFVQAAAPPNRPAEPVPAPAPAPSPAAPAAKPVADAPPRQNPPPASSGKDDFKNDPLIQKALEIFKGQIVEVRS
jgi:DNA polymerase-3 subunit gamma/tau